MDNQVNDLYIVTNRAMLYPWHQRRIRFKRMIRKWQLWGAVKALFNRGFTKPGVEIEGGRVFPLNQIVAIFKDSEVFADKKLIGLIENAQQSRKTEPDFYTNPYGYLESSAQEDEEAITDEEYELYKHIRTLKYKFRKEFNK